ncbi:MAG: hypothetical protein RSA49_05080 [Anaerovoracaceae bacterium]
MKDKIKKFKGLTSFYVIEIIDAQTIMINYGTSNGAVVGEDIKVIDIDSLDFITDPYDGSTIDYFYTVKEDLEIIRCYEKYSICQKIVISRSNLLENISNSSGFVRTEKKIKPLNVDDSKFSNRKITSQDPILIGDPVIIN